VKFGNLMKEDMKKIRNSSKVSGVAQEAIKS